MPERFASLPSSRRKPGSSAFLSRVKSPDPGLRRDDERNSAGHGPITNRLLLLLVLLLAPLAHADNATQRVVALGGDITETIYALNAQEHLVGVDSTSEWPADAKKLPNVGYVRQLSAEGILALRPTQIIATHDAGPVTVMEQLRQAGVALELLPASGTPQQVMDKVRQVGHLLGADAQAKQLNTRLAQTYTTLQSRVAGMSRHPRVVFLLSAGAGNFLAAGRDTAADHAMALAGGSNVIQGYSGYKPLSTEALVAAAPDVLVVMSERADGAGSIEQVLALPGMTQTPAGAHKQVIFVDGQALLGFGPRNADSELALQGKLAATQP